MFKKIMGSLVVVGLVGACVLGLDGNKAVVENDVAVNTDVKVEVVSNVGDGQEYAYEITDINETEIHGIALNKQSETNYGIFLYLDEVEFDVKLGDKIIVVWGEEEDEFEVIDYAVQLENGDYVSATSQRVSQLINKLENKF